MVRAEQRTQTLLDRALEAGQPKEQSRFESNK